MSLLDHYISKKLNPVPIKFNSKKNLVVHFKKRKNLIQNHLKIPEITLNNSKYLEFGCNGGENACYFAKNGSNIYLVEPNQRIHELIFKNFEKIKKKKSLKQLSKLDLDKFKTKKKFDFVVAEGFLNTLSNRNKLLLKLTTFMKKNSILVLNYDDIYGGVFELLKSYLLLSICNKLNFERYSKNSYNIAKKLFYDEFKKLNTSRSFYAWWADQLVNPYAAKTWSLEDIIETVNKNKLSLYSTSPIFFDLNYFKWYKDINIENNHEKNNNLFLSSWRKSLPQILFGKNINKTINVRKKDIQKIKKFSQKISNFITKPDNPFDLINFSEGFIKYLNLINKKELGKEIKNLLKLIKTEKSSEKIIKYYKKTKYLKHSWGSLLHYAAFIKE